MEGIRSIKLMNELVVRGWEREKKRKETARERRETESERQER